MAVFTGVAAAPGARESAGKTAAVKMTEHINKMKPHINEILHN
jgi:hypothetical protein